MPVVRQFVVGKTTKRAALKAVRDAHKGKSAPKRKKGREPYIMNAEQRKAELARVVRLRTARGTPMGDPGRWAWAIGNLCRVISGQVSAKRLQDMAHEIGLAGFDAAIVEQVVTELSAAAWGTYRLYTPRIAGRMIDLTRTEREAAHVEKIDAIDEPREERIRRLARDRKRRERARATRAALPRLNKSKLARQLGVNRITIHRWIKAGKLDPATGELRGDTLFDTVSNTTPYTEGILPREKTVTSGVPA